MAHGTKLNLKDIRACKGKCAGAGCGQIISGQCRWGMEVLVEINTLIRKHKHRKVK